MIDSSDPYGLNGLLMVLIAFSAVYWITMSLIGHGGRSGFPGRPSLER